MNGRNRHSGYTLVELLVVMAIIVMLSSVTIPTLIRSGFFSSDKSRTAARDLFAQLRAANVHATTNNVDAAIAYDVSFPQDSLFEATGINTGVVPQDYIDHIFDDYTVDLTDPANSNRLVLTESIFVRRLTIDEINERDDNGDTLAGLIIALDAGDDYDNYGNVKDDRPFVPVNNTFGTFQEFPAETCVLTNHPWTLLTDVNFTADTGLQPIMILRVFKTDGIFDVEPINPKVSNPADREFPEALPKWNNRFPAHIFKKSGGLDAATNKQRIVLSLGMKPDADYYDRYMVNDETDVLFLRRDFYGGYDPSDVTGDELVGIETDVIINVATGRVKVADDDET